MSKTYKVRCTRWALAEVIEAELKSDNLDGEVRWVAEHIHGILVDNIPEVVGNEHLREPIPGAIDRDWFLDQCEARIKFHGPKRLNILASDIIRIVENVVRIEYGERQAYMHPALAMSYDMQQRKKQCPVEKFWETENRKKRKP